MKKTLAVISVLAGGFFVLAHDRTPGAWNPNLSGAWVELGPGGGDVRIIARSPKAPKEYYALLGNSPGLIYRSTDSGQTWTRKVSIDTNCYDFVLDPTNSKVIYVPGWLVLYKSVNWGGSFSSVNYPGGVSLGDGARMVMHPTIPNVIYLGCHPTINSQSHPYMAIYKSADGGSSWTQTDLDYISGWNPEPVAMAISSLNPNIIYFVGYFGSNAGNRIYKTLDAGTTWQNVTPAFLSDASISISDIALDPKDANKVYVAHGTGVARTSDGAQTWFKQTTPLMFNAGSVAVDPNSSSILYAPSAEAVLDRGCYKSVNGGQTWKKIKSGIYGAGRRIVVGGGRIVIATSAGIFASVNGGSSFQPSHKGMKCARITHFALAPSAPKTIYAGVFEYGIFRSVNGGSTWIQGAELPKTNGRYVFMPHPLDPNTVYVGSGLSNDEDTECVLYKSTDGCKSYRLVLQDLFYNVVIDPLNPNRLVASGLVYSGGSNYAGVHISNDGGDTWSHIKVGTSSVHIEYCLVALDPSNGDTSYLYDGGYNAGTAFLYKSKDGGASWALLSEAMTRINSEIYCISVDPTNPNTVYVGTGNSGLWRSTDGGVRWHKVTGTSTSQVSGVMINRLNSNEIFLGSGSSVYFSNNRGASWAELDDGFPECDVVSAVDLAPISRKVFAGTDGGGIVKRAF